MSREKNARRNDSVYVVGSNAVAINPYVDDINEYRNEDESRKIKSLSDNREVYSINPASTCLLIMMILASIFICVLMLKAQFEVSDTSEEINVLRNELSELRKTNAQLESQINEALDLNQIREVAMNEYGMVFPEGQDVLEILPEPESYTIQYEIIEPVAEEKLTIKNMMAFITKGW